MSRHRGPMAGTFPRMLLDALAAAPSGVLPYAQAMQIMPVEYRSNKRFESLALKSLVSTWMMAVREGDNIRLLNAGDAFLAGCKRQEVAAKAVRYVGQIAAPRAAWPYKPLDMAKLMRGGPQRPGMNDLRDAPSLMGCVRVARK